MMTRMKTAIFAGLAALSGPASAQMLDDVVDGRLLTGWRMEDGRHMAAIELRLAPGWKTYWRAPGDAGIPPRFDWSGSRNLSGMEAHFPVPDVFWQNGLRSIGYEDTLVLPIELAPKRANEAIQLNGTFQIGVCEEICIPVSLQFEAELPPRAGSGGDAIRAALADRPLTAAEAGVGRVICGVEPIADGVRVTVSVEMPRMASSEEIVVEFQDPEVWIAEAETVRDGGRVTAVTEMVPPNAQPFAMARDGVRITVLGGGRAVDISGCTGG